MRRRQPGGRTDPYQEITGRIITALERGTVPWRTPWRARGHRNARSNRPYRGINTLVLQMTALERGWSDPRWLTYRQAEAAGGHVRRGEHGTRVVLWKWLERKEREDPERVERFPLIRLYSVFNVSQCEGVTLPARVDGGCPDPLERAEAVISGYRDGPSLCRDAESAYYVPEHDEVHVPPRAAFTDAHGYYATLFHELAHSTGHPRRLAREGYRTAARFGSERYSQEELVAEFAAAFLGSEAGIDPSRVEQSAAYIASWLRVLDDDKRLVVVAAAQGTARRRSHPRAESRSTGEAAGSGGLTRPRPGTRRGGARRAPQGDHAGPPPRSGLAIHDSTEREGEPDATTDHLLGDHRRVLEVRLRGWGRTQLHRRCRHRHRGGRPLPLQDTDLGTAQLRDRGD